MKQSAAIAMVISVMAASGAARAENWLDTKISDAMGLSQNFIDTDSVKKQPDGRYYFRVKSVIDGSKPIIAIDEYTVDCRQDMADDADEITISQLSKPKTGAPNWQVNDSLATSSATGKLTSYACRTLAKVPAPPPFAPTDAEQALCDAAKNGDADKIPALAAGHVKAACLKDGSQALHMAVLYDKPDAALALLKAGAPVDGKTKKNETPLMIVKSVAVAQILLDHHASLSAQDSTGDTPLYEVGVYALGTHGPNDPPEKIAEFFIAHGAKVNAVDKAGNTPLFAAAESGKVALVQMLLDHGADPKILSRGRSALDSAKFAKTMGVFYAGRPDAYDPPEHFDAIIALLREHGAPEAKTP